MISTKSTTILLLLSILPSPTMAALGGSEASIVTDQVHMKATRRIVSAAQYSVHEIQLVSGTLVREYISDQGQVFAVTWQGPFMPDLRQVLGSHFDDYKAAAKSKRARRGALDVQQPGLVVHSGGHMRAFFGHAYIPQLLPEGVTINELQ